jgi:hypothetical protein
VLHCQDIEHMFESIFYCVSIDINVGWLLKNNLVIISKVINNVLAN